LQRSLPSTERLRKTLVPRLWDALALAAIAFTLWKVFVAPRDLDLAHAQPAPHAAYKKLDGGTFRVTGARGRVLFLDFFASWCEPCKIEAPLVEKWARANPNAIVVPVDVGEPRVAAAEFARRYSLNNVALDPHSTAQAYFALEGFPTIVAIDPQGRIRGKWAGLNLAIGLAMSNAQKTLTVNSPAR
jgi:thiol-disulfide isomerase/thioredoxin